MCNKNINDFIQKMQEAYGNSKNNKKLSFESYGYLYKKIFDFVTFYSCFFDGFDSIFAFIKANRIIVGNISLDMYDDYIKNFCVFDSYYVTYGNLNLVDITGYSLDVLKFVSINTKHKFVRDIVNVEIENFSNKISDFMKKYSFSVSKKLGAIDIFLERNKKPASGGKTGSLPDQRSPERNFRQAFQCQTVAQP